ncbi:MAG TPA: hypothetical protein VGI21_22515 [Streptosporangiaceae bacterium]|jgi:hypothetical protein
MSTAAGDHAALHELEITVETELTVAQTSPREPAGDAAIGEWIPDPDAERYEVRLRALLGAVEALEDGSGAGAETDGR